jgi:hypothetical protein
MAQGKSTHMLVIEFVSSWQIWRTPAALQRDSPSVQAVVAAMHLGCEYVRQLPAPSSAMHSTPHEPTLEQSIILVLPLLQYVRILPLQLVTLESVHSATGRHLPLS